MLSRYVEKDLRVNALRIDEKRSSNKRGPNGNRWLYPDVVGMEDLSVDWHREVSDCVARYFDKKTKLWSFEVKLLINRSNVRECFFQAVSNSSWANLGYLVAAEVGGSDTLKELRLLSAAHGIGFIKLNAQNVDPSALGPKGAAHDQKAGRAIVRLFVAPRAGHSAHSAPSGTKSGRGRIKLKKRVGEAAMARRWRGLVG